MKRKSLKSQLTVEKAWSGVLAKIQDIKIRYRVVEHVMGQNIENLEAFSNGWAIVLKDDPSLRGQESGVTEEVIQKMESYTNPQAFLYFAKTWKELSDA